ncbi:MAG TPA: DUF305 domain-containing protein [Gemmatimonadales bacterium]
MRQTNASAAAAALLAALAMATMAACGGARKDAVQPAPAPAASAQGEQAAIARARADSIRRPWTGADVRFMQHMIVHHAQAIEMAAMAPTHGASPQVRTLAERIANGQRDEIATMQRWLRDRQQDVPEVHLGGTHDAHDAHDAHVANAADTAVVAHDAHAVHEAPMPGMLTEAELRTLDAARGREFDRLFLTYMIRHHRGAVSMVRDLFGSYGAGQDETVFRLATDVNVDQLTEIARMERMLLALAIEGVSR